MGMIISPQYMVDQLIDALERNNFIITRWDAEKTSNSINAYVIAQIPQILLDESMQWAVDDLTNAGIRSTISYQYNGRTEVEIKMSCFPRTQQERYEYQDMTGRRITREALINDNMGVFAPINYNELSYRQQMELAEQQLRREKLVAKYPADWYNEKEEEDGGVI